MSKKDERLFNPVRVHKKGGWKLILVSFLVFLLVFGGGILVYLSTKVDSFSIDKIMSVFEKDDESENPSVEEGKVTNILFMSVSSAETLETGEREIYFIVLGKLNSNSNQVKFCPLQVKNSYISAFESGGANDVVKQIESEYSIDIHRYVSSNENTFALAVNYMDGLEFDVPQRVEYRTKDLTLILTPGKQTIKGESLLKYLKYFKAQGLSGQGELFCAMVEDYFDEKNIADPMKVYKGVLSELSGNSDITFVDCADNIETLEKIAQNESTKAVSTSSIEEFR